MKCVPPLVVGVFSAFFFLAVYSVGYGYSLCEPDMNLVQCQDYRNTVVAVLLGAASAMVTLAVATIVILILEGITNDD